GRLEHEGVAARDRNRKHPHRNHRGKIERRDAGAYAKGLPHRPRIDSVSYRLAEFAFKQMGNAAGEFDHLEPARHLAARIAQHFSMLRGYESGERISIALDQRFESKQNARAV